MRKRILLLIFAFTVIFTVNAGAAIGPECDHGFYTYYDHKLSGGVGSYGNFRRYFWVSTSSAVDKKIGEYFRTNGGVDNIGNAFKYWTNTSPDYPNVTTSISWRETKTKSEASIEISGRYLSDNDGTTIFKIYDRDANESKEDWGWAIIYLNPEASALNEKAETGCIEHEIGHAMGLSHQPSSKINDSLMCTDRYRKMEDGTTSRNKPSKLDCRTINHIYG